MAGLFGMDEACEPDEALVAPVALDLGLGLSHPIDCAVRPRGARRGNGPRLAVARFDLQPGHDHLVQEVNVDLGYPWVVSIDAWRSTAPMASSEVFWQSMAVAAAWRRR
jgi:hypothetical protein